ncbi:hypothetical protein [Acetivibrio clariflavus]|uniref:hypothetical protein n=1 Tax=Acetivibrio clariflavus TaxID=288965 RepID=UPI0004B9511E|nr:hypothetical protein [Acetivibrio clariflavus]
MSKQRKINTKDKKVHSKNAVQSLKETKHKNKLLSGSMSSAERQRSIYSTAFGNILNRTGTTVNSYMFAGE